MLPVQHTRNLADASLSVRNEIFAVAAQLTSAVLNLYGAEGSIVFQNNTTPDAPSSTCTCTWCRSSASEGHVRYEFAIPRMSVIWPSQ